MRYEHFSGDHMDGGGWVAPVILVLVLVVLAAVLVVWLVRNPRAHAGPSLHRDAGGSARELLDRRLVSGEISEEDYRRLRAALSDAPPPGQSPAAPAHPQSP